jgi:hypothetical protein
VARIYINGIIEPFISLIELATGIEMTSLLEHILCVTQNVLASAAVRVHVSCRFETVLHWDDDGLGYKKSQHFRSLRPAISDALQ